MLTTLREIFRPFLPLNSTRSVTQPYNPNPTPSRSPPLNLEYIQPHTFSGPIISLNSLFDYTLLFKGESYRIEFKQYLMASD